MLLQLVLVLGNANTATTATNSIKLGGKDAGQYVTNDKFTVVTGTITIYSGDSSSGSGSVSYPSGFNKDNCIIIALAVLINGYYQYYNTGNGNTLSATLYSNNISLSMRNYSSLATGSYTAKIVLMKIS